MDRHSIVDQNPSPAAGQPNVSPMASDPGERRKETRFTPDPYRSVSGGLAHATGSAAAPRLAPRAVSEAARGSLAEMAQRDLDAALQLLAERAQYITGATGAAIALRRDGNHDMLCRASTGPNAPELGALLSAEFGLSGESVRARLPLRCDDVERDARVNREGCRHLGVSSVAVMPILGDDQVLGVFELFSGRVNAFEERDLSALQRLGEMVETAVRLARTAQPPPPELMGEFVAEVSNVPVVEAEAEAAAPGSTAEQGVIGLIEAADVPVPEPAVVELPGSRSHVPAPGPSQPAEVPTPLRKPLLWTAASQPETKPAEPDRSRVPPVLRNLRKCQACGFPVSEGRTLCVECEEKQWRGQLRVPARSLSQPPPAAATAKASAACTAAATAVGPAKLAASATGRLSPGQPLPPTSGTSALSVVPSSSSKARPAAPVQTQAGQAIGSTLSFLSSGVSSSPSWFSANKYILAGIVVVAMVLAAIALLR
jgi:hypothetical protein